MKKLIVFSLFTCLVISSVFCFADKAKVLVIESYDPRLEWTAQCEKGIASVLEDQAALSYFYMDTKRIPETEFPVQANMAWDLYLKEKPDLVMIGDDNGLRLLGPRFAQTATPVVYFGINNNPRHYFETMPENITGLLERTPVIPWLRYLKRIMPRADSALVLMDSSPTTQAIVEVTFQGKTHLNVGGIQAEYHIADNWDQWRDYITNSGKYSLLLLPTFHAVKDKDGHHMSVKDVIEWTSAHSPSPLFTNQDYTVSDTGVAGAYVIFGESHGKQAAEIARDILLGKQRVGQIPPKTDRTGKFYFNKKQMGRFKLEIPREISSQAIFK